MDPTLPLHLTTSELVGHYLVLEPAARSARRSGARVVLLHGWHQSSECWLKTACELRDRYGHSVLLLDWLGHGRSPCDPRMMTPELLLLQLERALALVGWDIGGKVALAGISLGGGMSMRYASKHPGEGLERR